MISLFSHDSEVSLPITSIQRINLTHELIRPKASITVGMKCLCKFGADEKFYDVEVAAITSMGYTVIYTQYGNSEEVSVVGKRKCGKVESSRLYSRRTRVLSRVRL